MTIRKRSLVEALGDNLGEEKARRLLDDATKRAGFDGQTTFQKDEALTILEEISEDDDAGSMERISANTLQTQVRSGDIER